LYALLLESVSEFRSLLRRASTFLRRNRKGFSSGLQPTGKAGKRQTEFV